MTIDGTTFTYDLVLAKLKNKENVNLKELAQQVIILSLKNKLSSELLRKYSNLLYDYGHL